MVISFAIIACMRVIQSICGKTASKEVNAGEKFFRYGAYYQFVASLLAFILLAITGFYGFNLQTAVCAVASALLFIVELYTNIQSMKGAPLTVCTMFSLGGLVVSCAGGMLLFGESVTIAQAGGLIAFLVGAYLLVSKGKNGGEKINPRTYVSLFINLLSNGLIMVVQKYFSVKVQGGNVLLFSFLTFLLNAVIMASCVAFMAIKRRNRAMKKDDCGGNRRGSENIYSAEETHGEAQENNIDSEIKEKPQKEIFGLSKTLIVCGALLALALFAINYLVTELGKTVDSVILFPASSAISIGITAIVGWCFFKEKLTIKNFLGLIVGLAGIIVIGVC